MRFLIAGTAAAFTGGVGDVGRVGLHGDGEAVLAGPVELHVDARAVRLPFGSGQRVAVVPAFGNLIQVHVLQARAVLAGAIG
ncbi:hypothetical protein D9M72_602910 [compost metagenome]